ncbi:hypothetical protein LJR090_002573 [Bosea sp. LjRoot90]|uniref:hypothetical protein n=1 Tax=Bosea sp. LjRoot90 TaxID=3342342 RepID=UPI003ECE851E
MDQALAESPSLILRRTCPDHHDEKERDKLWGVDCEGVYVGSIVLHQGRSDNEPVWQWVVHLHAGRFQNGLRGNDGSAATREDAMIAFRQAFQRCLAHIGDAGWQHHLEHMAMLRARAGPRKY